jgi:hypothetical protein
MFIAISYVHPIEFLSDSSRQYSILSHVIEFNKIKSLHTGEVRVDAVRYLKYNTGTDRRCIVLSRDADFSSR